MNGTGQLGIYAARCTIDNAGRLHAENLVRIEIGSVAFVTLSAAEAEDALTALHIALRAVGEMNAKCIESEV